MDIDGQSPILVHPLEEGPPSWVTMRIERAARQEGLTYYEFLDKYQPSLDAKDWDDDAASGFEAWA